MPRTLLLITDLKIGGTPTVVRELALRLKSAGGAHVEVACLAPWGPVADEIVSGGVAVTALNAQSSLSLAVVSWRLVRLIRDHRIDTVFSFLVHANMVAAAAALVCPGVRRLQSIQTTQAHPRWQWSAQSLAQQAAERIVVPSPSVAKVARDWASVPAEKIVVIPNAVDIEQFRGAVRAHSISSASNGSIPPRIGFIGRLDPVKRIGDLLVAMKLLGRSAHLHIFGEGKERRHIEETIVRLGLSDRVTLHGAVPRPQEALARIDLLVLPSEAEGFGLVLIEAMAAGVPVVATDVPGIRDVVRQGDTGVLAPVASPSRLAQAIASLLDNPARRDALVAAAKEDVRRRFSWEVVLPQYRKLLGV